jgi:hypothetical protein
MIHWHGFCVDLQSGETETKSNEVADPNDVAMLGFGMLAICYITRRRLN